MLAILLALAGMTAIDLNSGRTISMHGAERFPMGSVYKFPIALAVLREVDRGKLRLDAKYTLRVSDFREGVSPIRERAKGKPITLTMRELIAEMLGRSDNTACDFLLTLVPPPAVTKYVRDIGVNGIIVSRSERDIARDIHTVADGVARYAKDPRDTSTPDAMAELLRRFARGEDGLSRASHDFAMQTMLATPTGPNRIKAGVPADAKVAHKIGTMPGTLNDVGIVTSADGKHRLVLAIFTKESSADTAAREKQVAELAAQAYRELAK
jgi:beta-lactamase class A